MKKQNIKLDTYEQNIESQAEKLKPASKKTKATLESIIERERKSKSISLRFSIQDLEKVKAKAHESGLPYQTLITMVMHKYVTDQFFDKNEVMKTLQIYRKQA